jgi:hypothetical protein
MSRDAWMSGLHQRDAGRLLADTPVPGQCPWAVGRIHKNGAEVSGGARSFRLVQEHAGSVAPPPDPALAPAASAVYTRDIHAHSDPAALAVRLLAAAV